MPRKSPFRDGVLTEDRQDNARKIGMVLREARLATGKTQEEVGVILGYTNGNFVGKFERGEFHLPPDKYVTVADLYGLDIKKFALKILESYDPILYEILFGSVEAARKFNISPSARTERIGARELLNAMTAENNNRGTNDSLPIGRRSTDAPISIASRSTKGPRRPS